MRLECLKIPQLAENQRALSGFTKLGGKVPPEKTPIRRLEQFARTPREGLTLFHPWEDGWGVSDARGGGTESSRLPALLRGGLAALEVGRMRSGDSAAY